MSTDGATAMHGRRPLRWAAALLAQKRAAALRIGLLSCLASLLALSQPVLAMIVVDDGALAGNMKVLAISCVVMVLAPLVGLALESVTRFDYLDLSSHVLFGLRERVFAHLQTLSPVYYSRVGFGELAARFDGDLAETQRFLVDGPLAVLSGIFSFALLTALMFLLDARLAALVLVAVVPAQVAAGCVGRAGIEARTRAVRDGSTRLSSYFLDSLRALKSIQSTNGEAARLTGLRQRHGDYHAALRAAQHDGFRLVAWQRVSAAGGAAIILGGGGYLLAAGQISVGVLVAFIGFAARAAAPVHSLLGVQSGWRRVQVSLARLAEVLDAAPTPPRAISARLPAEPRGDIRFVAVSVAYAADQPVLRDASLHIAAGQSVLLVGPSGAGKSTVADLLLGHLAADSGRILIDGIDIATVPLADLRRHIAVVDQEPVFFPGSVADNLRAAAPQASDATLDSALADAGLGGELSLTTAVGAASSALSRGQRLRLALARALLQRPAILVLDETTSSVDADAEAAIVATVDRLFAGRTRLIISHHPSPAFAGARRLTLDAGQFVELATEAADGGPGRRRR